MAAVARGVRVSRVKISLFILTAAMASFAGITSSIRVQTANPNAGFQYELEVIAMTVIGGTVLTGGKGTIIGTVIGVLLLRIMRNGMARDFSWQAALDGYASMYRGLFDYDPWRQRFDLPTPSHAAPTV